MFKWFVVDWLICKTNQSQCDNDSNSSEEESTIDFASKKTIEWSSTKEEAWNIVIKFWWEAFPKSKLSACRWLKSRRRYHRDTEIKWQVPLFPNRRQTAPTSFRKSLNNKTTVLAAYPNKVQRHKLKTVTFLAPIVKLSQKPATMKQFRHRPLKKMA